MTKILTGDAPCGCRFAIPNEAYYGPEFLPVPCTLHDKTWAVVVRGGDIHWAPTVDELLAVPGPGQGVLELTGTARCRACDAPVLWRKHVGSGKPAPIDALPVDGGNVVLIDPDGYTIIGPDDPGVPEGTLRYTSHFARCPQADEFRSRR